MEEEGEGGGREGVAADPRSRAGGVVPGELCGGRERGREGSPRGGGGWRAARSGGREARRGSGG